MIHVNGDKMFYRENLPEAQEPGQARDLVYSSAILCLVQFLTEDQGDGSVVSRTLDGIAHTSRECLPSSTFQANVINFIAKTIWEPVISITDGGMATRARYT